MSSIDDRVLALEEDRHTQRKRWVAAAARTAGLHRPDDALRLVDVDQITTSGDADRAVAGLLEQRPYLGRELISEGEQRRRWGAELLAGLLGDS